MTEADVVAQSSDDIAWASLLTPLSVAALIEFCRQDIERLLRINPFLEFSKWQDLGDGHYHFVTRNFSQEIPFEVDTGLRVELLPTSIKFIYDAGLKRQTTFLVEPAPQGSKLTITDLYNGELSEIQKLARLDEVDKSLHIWAKDLQLYLIRWGKWSRFAPWRWYITKVWQPMKPTARRITYMLLWISAVEIALILLGVAVYFMSFS
jgi:hypothetical protein